MVLVKVLIADAHPLVREGICSSLAEARNMTVVGEAADGLEAETKALHLKPDVVLLDISLPLRDGFETARAIRASLAETRIIILTDRTDPDELIEAACAGAEGYITKDMPSHKVVAAIRSALAGDPPISGSVALKALRKLGQTTVGANPGAAPLTELTMRQLEIVRLLSDGLTNKEIANFMGVSQQTVGDHLKTIFRKLGVHSRAEAAWVYLLAERTLKR